MKKSKGIDHDMTVGWMHFINEIDQYTGKVGEKFYAE